MTFSLNLDGGSHAGPLFVIQKKRKLVRPKGKGAWKVHVAQTKRATPPWLTAEQKAEIRLLYKKARYLTAKHGELYVVDHIVPKIHPLVCGLHVPWNLQVIHWMENAKKGAWTFPGMPHEQIGLFENEKADS